MNTRIVERIVVQIEQQGRQRAENVERDMHGVESAMDEERERQCPWRQT